MSSRPQTRVPSPGGRGQDHAEQSAVTGPGVVVVRLWAGAKAAAGTGEVVLDVPGPVSVAWLRDALLDRAPDAGRLARVLQVCSVLVGDRPSGAADPQEVLVQPGSSVEFLPPFAGG